MKVRNGFVSNSSSSSFMILKNNLTEEQIEKIKNHIDVVSKKRKYFDEIHFFDEDDAWTITESELCIAGQVWMDNFDMRCFLSKIGVEEEYVDWGEGFEDWI